MKVVRREVSDASQFGHAQISVEVGGEVGEHPVDARPAVIAGDSLHRRALILQTTFCQKRRLGS
jgi:hypothetical protein